MVFCCVARCALSASSERLIRTFLVVTLLSVLTGCTQQLAQRSQSKWLEDSPSRPLFQTSISEVAGPFRGSVTTVLSGYLESKSIGELSGLAASHKNPGVFFAINDSGNHAELFALDRTGKHLQTFRLPDRNIDWEDLSSFQHKGRSWLAIADTGDNLRRRATSVLYLFEEPTLDVIYSEHNDFNTARTSANRTLPVQSKLEFSYEDGPQNVESMAISSEDSAIYLVAKHGAKSSLYQLPLNLESDSARLTAKRVGETAGLRWHEDDSWLERRLGSRFLLGPTAMDISADNKLAVIANYRHLYLYRKPDGKSWQETLRTEPQIISSHRMAQSESVAFSADGNYIIVGSEGPHAPVLLVR